MCKGGGGIWGRGGSFLINIQYYIISLVPRAFPRECLWSSEIKKMRDVCSESKRYSYRRVHQSVFKGSEQNKAL